LKNESSHLLSGAVIRVGSGTGSVGDIGPGHSRFVWLPRGGDATFSIEFSSLVGSTVAVPSTWKARWICSSCLSTRRLRSTVGPNSASSPAEWSWSSS